MINLEETSEYDSTINEEPNQSDFSFDINQTINRSTSNRSSWLRSIPRRIRKLISKSTKRLERARNENANNSERISSTGSRDQFYTWSDDDEELAMKSARSQMAK